MTVGERLRGQVTKDERQAVVSGRLSAVKW